MSWYLDSSAILKLIFDEDESDAIRQTLGESPTTSSLSRLEVTRVVRRTNPDDLQEAKKVLAKLAFIPINEAVIRIAEGFSDAPTLRSLDAIHLSSALLVQGSIEGIITYDLNMVRFAREFGLHAITPR